jgi:hypothetical protein
MVLFSPASPLEVGNNGIPLSQNSLSFLNVSLKRKAINKKYKQPPSQSPALRGFRKKRRYERPPMSQANLFRHNIEL